MIKTKFYKGYEITIEKTRNGMLILKANDFKFRYMFFTEKEAIKNFVQLLNSI
jgi:hypothetical protein